MPYLMQLDMEAACDSLRGVLDEEPAAITSKLFNRGV